MEELAAKEKMEELAAKAKMEELIAEAKQEKKDQQTFLERYSFKMEDDKLGMGAFGSVFLVRDKSNICYVVKQIHRKIYKAREFDVAITLDHPNIMKTHNKIVVGYHVFHVTEFVKGGDLDKWIEKEKEGKRPPNPTIAKVIIKQTSLACRYMHKNHKIHRDIKPANLLLTNTPGVGDFQVKVSDFGCSKCLVGSHPHSMVGDMRIMAPEVLNGKMGERYTTKADCWSLGIVYYYLLCYEAYNLRDEKKVLTRPESISGTEHDAEWAVLQGLLQEDPAQRLSAEDALLMLDPACVLEPVIILPTLWSFIPNDMEYTLFPNEKMAIKKGDSSTPMLITLQQNTVNTIEIELLADKDHRTMYYVGFSLPSIVWNKVKGTPPKALGTTPGTFGYLASTSGNILLHGANVGHYVSFQRDKQSISLEVDLINQKAFICNCGVQLPIVIINIPKDILVGVCCRYGHQSLKVTEFVTSDTPYSMELTGSTVIDWNGPEKK